MRPSSPTFISHVDQRVRHHFTASPISPTLRREVPLHPARFVVGLDTLAQAPPALLKSTGECGNLRHYIGRAEEVSADGLVTAALWECPGGGELQATLKPEHFTGPAPVTGDGLRVQTWVERIRPGELVDHVHAEVVRRPWTAEERVELDALLALLAAPDTAPAP